MQQIGLLVICLNLEMEWGEDREWLLSPPPAWWQEELRTLVLLLMWQQQPHQPTWQEELAVDDDANLDDASGITWSSHQETTLLHLAN